MVNVNEVPAIIISFVLIAMIAGIGVLINSELRDTTGIESVVIENESYYTTNVSDTTNVTLSSESLAMPTNIIVGNYSEEAIIGIGNGQNDGVLGNTGNYTIIELTPIGPDAEVTTPFVIQFTNSTDWNDTAVNISYTITRFSTTGEIYLNGTSGVRNITNQLSTVGTIVGVGVIIGVLALLYIGFNRKQRY